MTIDGNNFTRLGFYNWGIDCQNYVTKLKGGVVIDYYEVTPAGNSGTDNIMLFIFVILMFYVITFFGFFGKNAPITVLGGMAMMGIGIYIINEGLFIYRDWITNYFSYVTIALGAIMALWAIIEMIQDEM